jgi:putative membrane-bound dehydrogenase-like protein
MLRFFLCAAALLVVARVARSESPNADSTERDYSAELPRIPPLSPVDALGSFEVESGFALEQAACEPRVTDPVAVDFDEHGRLFVVEMLGYSENADDMAGRIRLLEDKDHDGIFERSTIYADGLGWPTAVLCYDGGIFVGAAPEILYYKDADGDGRAEIRQVVFNGFGTDNVQGLLNSFRWGLDNRIHVAVSSCGARLVPGNQPAAEPLVLRGRNLSFDPRTFEVRAESGASQHGYFIDPLGREFTCNNSNHIQQIVGEDAELSRNPYLQSPSALRSIAVEGPSADVFRLSPVEPWREIRTRLRAKGIVPGAVEGGGRPAGYFTSATGVTIYTGDAWPADFRGNAFIGDVGSNLVHRKILQSSPNRVEMEARRATPDREFIASRDIWFRPVQFANAPDGNLYVLDMYREVIEHPISLPPVIKKHLDLTSGRDRGRLYRIVRTNRTEDQRQSQFNRGLSGKESLPELVAMLCHPNGWHRTTAARLLYERQDPATARELRRLLESAQSPVEGRLLALYGLQNFAALDASVLQSTLRDTDSVMREHAVRLVGRWLRDPVNSDSASRSQVERSLAELVADPDLKVRYRVALALGECQEPDRTLALATVVRRDIGNQDITSAALSSLATGGEALLRHLVTNAEFTGNPAGRSFLSEISREIGARGDKQELASLASSIVLVHVDHPELASELLVAALQGAGPQAASVQNKLVAGANEIKSLASELVSTSMELATDEKVQPAKRATAISRLAMGKFSDVAPVLTELIALEQPPQVQQAALSALGSFNEPAVAEPIVAAWSGMSPSLRSVASNLLLSRPATSTSLVAAVESGQLAPGDLDPATIQRLRTHADEHVRNLAAHAFAASQRSDAIEAYNNALDLVGDASHGRALFRQHCAACHRREGYGTGVGADLATVITRSPEALLISILDPSREVDSKFIQFNLVTVDGIVHTGYVSAETASSVTLTGADNTSQTVPRAEIEMMRSTGKSLMPDGFENNINQQGMADLIAYLRSQP